MFDKTIKVLTIIAEGRFGGPQRQILELAKGLKEHKIETMVVCPNYDSTRFQNLLKEQNTPFKAIRIHRITKDIGHLLKFIILFIPELLHLMRIIKEYKPDIVHCNGAWQIKGIIAAKLTKTRSYWYLNDTYMPGYILWLFRIISKLFGDEYIGSSIRTQQFYAPHLPKGKEDMTIVLPPVNTDQFNPETNDTCSDIEAYEGLKVVTVANVNPIKGYEMFVEMVAKVNASTKIPCKFFAAGKKLDNQQKLLLKLNNRMKELNIDNVELMGGRVDVTNILKSADVFVCCSLSESGPMVVFEAMSMENPVVSTDVGDVATLFGNKENGIIVPVNDADQMAKEVVMLLEDEAKRLQLGKNARKVAINVVDTACCVRAHANAYRNTIYPKAIATSII